MSEEKEKEKKNKRVLVDGVIFRMAGHPTGAEREADKTQKDEGTSKDEEEEEIHTHTTRRLSK